MTAQEEGPEVGARRPAAPWDRRLGPLGPAGPLVVLLAVTAVGAWARARGLTHLGLWRDDAWVALSGRVGPRTAVRMSVTTPGFTLALRSWLGLADPATSWWGQLLPLALGILGPPAAYALARCHRLSVRLSLVAAAIVAASPVATTYSTRLKQYALDLLLACLLLALAERARRAPSHRTLRPLALAAVAALLVSGSTAPALAGAWGAVALDVLWRRDRAAWRPVLTWGAVTAAGAGATFLACYRHLPPGITTVWQDHYLDLSSVDGARRTVALTAPRLLAGFVPFASSATPWVALGVLVLVGLGGLAAGRAAWAPALTVAAAVVAAALERSPLGTGRIDEVLYPALVLLVVLGLAAAGRSGAALVGHRVPVRTRRLTAVVLTGALLLAGASASLRDDVRYPGTDLTTLVARSEELRVPGTLLVVEARTRYLWALTQEDDLDVVFGSSWLTGFTVASHRPDVFLQPSYSVEQGYTPLRWVELTRGATQVQYLSTPFEGTGDAPDQAFLALRRAGWVPQQEVEAAGGRLVVLVRSPGPAG